MFTLAIHKANGLPVVLEITTLLAQEILPFTLVSLLDSLWDAQTTILHGQIQVTLKSFCQLMLRILPLVQQSMKQRLIQLTQAMLEVLGFKKFLLVDSIFVLTIALPPISRTVARDSINFTFVTLDRTTSIKTEDAIVIMG